MLHESILARLPLPNGGALTLTVKGQLHTIYINTVALPPSKVYYQDRREAMAAIMDAWYSMRGGQK